MTVALPLVKAFEGCHLTAYPNPESGGAPWTIGWGNTSYVDGTPVKAGDMFSQELAEALLVGHLERDRMLLAQRIPCSQDLNLKHQAELLSFTFNCGTSWFGGEDFTTLTSRLRHRGSWTRCRRR